ncbi:MAG TPA: class I SAM-dependent methyltransferase [Candidatus Dormibacteraeota bacterium]|nr:class I SAM-dependent methyltransferase [Candidatus Dormibacteraeota bacterium]
MTLKAQFWAATRALPLWLRKPMAGGLGLMPLEPERRRRLVMLALADWAIADDSAFHAFLWRNHLGYAQQYDLSTFDRMPRSRLLFFEEMVNALGALNRRREEVRAVLEVGSSTGHNLRYLETSVFRHAEILHGIDLDAHAVREGARYLRDQGSRVQLRRGDVTELGRLLGGQRYDLVFSAGLLLYLNQQAAEVVVGEMVEHSSWLTAMSDLANPRRDNRMLGPSERRLWDRPAPPQDASPGTFWVYTHNVDAMLARLPGRIVARHFESEPPSPDETVYFVFFAPG